jgi:GNAT superfamily N-acetyltransferase
LRHKAGTSPPSTSRWTSRATAWPARRASSPSWTAGSSAPSPCAAPSEAYIADPPPPLYTTPGTAILSQLAVHPDCRGLGLGERLIDAAEAWAREQGFTQLALDTAEPAVALRRRYERRGYVTAGSVQWQGKTYVSVLMRKPLA